VEGVSNAVGENAVLRRPERVEHAGADCFEVYVIGRFFDAESAQFATDL
jgi:hypothetical protein